MMKKKLIIPKEGYYAEVDSPIGVLTIVTSDQGLHAIIWNNTIDKYRDELKKLSQSVSEKNILQTKKQLTEYFAGIRQSFDLPLVLHGTDFQIAAWKTLQIIPYGKTFSYQQQATHMGDKQKARAVGMANGCNPISIVIPCHRVIGSNGKLVGFGGGLDKKAYLLDLEKRNSALA